MHKNIPVTIHARSCFMQEKHNIFQNNATCLNSADLKSNRYHIQIRALQAVLGNLAANDDPPFDPSNLFYSRFMDTNDMNDLEKAIAHCREALASQGLTDTQHFSYLHKLSVSCKTSYERDVRRVSDLLCAAESSIAAESLAVEIDHPYLTWFHFCIERTEHPDAPDIDPDTPLRPSVKTSACTNASAESRFCDAVELAEAARAQGLPCAVQMYRTAFLIAERCLVLRFSPTAQHEFLSRRDVHTLPSRAASCAVQAGDLEAALELLEQGRGQIWARLRDYRYPLENLPVVSEELCDRFRKSCVLLELLSAADDDSGERSTYKKDVLEGWNDTLREIRKLDGFEGFLQPKRYDALRAAAATGPVVVLYVDSSRSDAIIIQSDRTLAPSLVSLAPSLYEMAPEFAQAVAHLDGQTRRIVLSDPVDGPSLSSVLKSTWKYICQPVAARLRALGISEQSHIWWCPVGVLTSLPIHAAGPYEGGEKNLLDIYVSSYAPSLLSLIRAQADKKDSVGVVRRSVRLLAVGQSNALAKVKDELGRINERFSNSAAQILDVTTATVEAVMHKLRTGDFNLLHFSCHGYLDVVRPFESYLALYESNLALKTLAYGATLYNTPLAFLAACYSAAGEAAGSRNAPTDEIVSLAAAFQVAGVQSVVGTLWAMFDADGPALSDAFYGYLLPGGVGSSDCLALEPALALHLAVKNMRDHGLPLERWSTFVHIGI
ncbi:CHAT domain-containing protein [Mycena pura]|uniref:CHAT domain-containing protein n=1 Tax=Mycena pura TaxID=153505 RepID=A0AAD6VA84_9AGAR|nr:CHAT domain-containing protein [Mycena pura]